MSDYVIVGEFFAGFFSVLIASAVWFFLTKPCITASVEEGPYKANEVNGVVYYKLLIHNFGPTSADSAIVKVVVNDPEFEKLTFVPKWDSVPQPTIAIRGEEEVRNPEYFYEIFQHIDLVKGATERIPIVCRSSDKFYIFSTFQWFTGHREQLELRHGKSYDGRIILNSKDRQKEWDFQIDLTVPITDITCPLELRRHRDPNADKKDLTTGSRLWREISLPLIIAGVLGAVLTAVSANFQPGIVLLAILIGIGFVGIGAIVLSAYIMICNDRKENARTLLLVALPPSVVVAATSTTIGLHAPWTVQVLVYFVLAALVSILLFISSG